MSLRTNSPLFIKVEPNKNNKVLVYILKLLLYEMLAGVSFFVVSQNFNWQVLFWQICSILCH